MFKDNLIKARKSKNITQEEIANYLQIKRQTYSAYERGISSPDLLTLQKIAKFLDVPVSYLLKEETNLDDDIEKSSADDEVWELREMLHKRPELKILFSMTQKATKEDIEQVIRIVDALKPKEYED